MATSPVAIAPRADDRTRAHAARRAPAAGRRSRAPAGRIEREHLDVRRQHERAAATRTLENGLARHHADDGSARTPAASTVRPRARVRAAVEARSACQRADLRQRRRSCRRRSGRRPSRRSGAATSSTSCDASWWSSVGAGAGWSTSCRRTPAHDDVGAGAAVSPSIGSGCSVSSSPAQQPAPASGEGSDGRRGDVTGRRAHERATPASASTRAAAGGTKPSPVPVGPVRPEPAHPRRQLDLHAAERRHVHRVVRVQPAQLAGDRVEVVDDLVVGQGRRQLGAQGGRPARGCARRGATT